VRVTRRRSQQDGGQSTWHDEDENSVIEAKNHEATPPQVDDADMTGKLCEELGVDFELILQAKKANTRLFTGVHKMEPEEESDDDVKMQEKVL